MTAIRDDEYQTTEWITKLWPTALDMSVGLVQIV